MAALREAAAAATRGEPTGVVLIGEAGVGKTRLATELARELEANRALVFVSHGVHLSGGELPYAGITELVRGMVRTVGAADMTRAAGRDLRALSAFHRALGDEQAPDRAAVTAAVLAVIEGLGRGQTLVWVVDDLQWLDAASGDLVSYVVKVAHQTRMLLLATVRDSPAGADDAADHALQLVRTPGVTSLPVRPLSDEAVDAQARSLSARPLGAADVERIRRLSDGLPFFVEELVAADGHTPTTLRKAVTMPTRDLADRTRLLLRAAALEETLARPDLVAKVAGLTDAELRPALDEARGRDLLRVDRDDDVVRFRHALLREAVEDELLAGERRTLHRRWAEALAGAVDDAPATARVVVGRARHWLLTEDPRAAYPHVLAAARCVHRMPDQAAQVFWWERVLETWPEDGDTEITRDQALQNVFLACSGTGDVRRALTVLERELARGDESDEVRSLWLLLTHRHLARLAKDLRGVPQAPTDADALFAWLQGLGPDFRVSVVLHLLLHEWNGDRPDLYLPICAELARRGEEEDDVENWYLAMRHRGWWQQSQGDFDGQLDTARAAREVVLARMPARRLEAEWDWCWGLEESGRYAAARDAAEEALATVDEPRALLKLWLVLVGCVAASNSSLGDWEAARAWIARAEAVEGVGGDNAVAGLMGQLTGEIAARTGELQRAREVLRAVESASVDVTAVWSTLPVAALAAEIALVTGDGALAEQALADLERQGHAVGGPDPLAQCLLSLSRLAGSGSDGLLERVLEAGDRLLPPGGLVQAAVRAELGEHQRRLTGSDTGDGWSQVVAGWHALGRVYDVAWCRHLQALAAVRDGDREGAAAALADAWRISGELGAHPLHERIGASARRTRLNLDGLASDTVADLTERETEVLRLLALGRTNGQIAEQLVISPKTASVHVSRILAKLGAANRTEAAAAARRLGVG
jgi:DNA-binding CsgD family transcriptional regulator